MCYAQNVSVEIRALLSHPRDVDCCHESSEQLVFVFHGEGRAGQTVVVAPPSISSQEVDIHIESRSGYT